MINKSDIDSNSSDVYSFDSVWFPLVIILFIIYPFLIIITNTISCIVFFSKKYRKSRPKQLMGNIALADIMFITVIISFVTTCSSTKESGFRLIWCEPLSSILLYTPNYVSALTMTVISYDRYRMFVHTFQINPLSKISTHKLLAVIWFLSFILTLPEMIQIDSYAIDFEHKRYLCIKRKFFIQFDPNLQSVLYFYILIILYLLPIFITSYFYFKIFYNFTTNFKQNVGTNINELQLKNRRKKYLKSTIMQILIVLVYMVCWLPVYIFLTINTELCNTTNLLFAIQCLALSSCALNPVIYWWLNKQFRKDVKLLLTCDQRFYSERSVSFETTFNIARKSNASNNSEIGFINCEILI